MSAQAVGAFNYRKLTHAALSSPLWGHVAVAGCARGPIRWHRDLVGGNRRWWWSCQQGSWHNKSTTHKFNQIPLGIRSQSLLYPQRIPTLKLTSWHGHGGACYHSHGHTVVAGRRDGRGVHGCGHPVWLDHSRVMDDMRRRSIQWLCVVSALLLWRY